MDRSHMASLAILLFAATAPAVAPPTVPRLWDHRGSVLALSFSPDGKKLLSGGAPHAAVWDSVTGKRLVVFEGSGLVYSAAFSPDGKRVATAGWIGVREPLDKEAPDDEDKIEPRAAVWDAATGRELFALKTLPAGPHPCLAWSPDGKTLAAAGAKEKGEDAVCVVRFVDATTGKTIKTIEGTIGVPGSIAFSPDGKTLAVSEFGPATACELWDVAAGKPLRVLRSTQTWTIIRRMAFSPDGKTLAWGGYNETNGNKELRLWEVATGKDKGLVKDGYGAVAFSPDGKTLAAVCEEGVRLWDYPSLKLRAILETPSMPSASMGRTLTFSSDGKHLAAGANSPDLFAAPSRWFGGLAVWELPSLRERLSPEDSARRLVAEAEARLLEKRRLADEARQREEVARLPKSIRDRLERAESLARRHAYALGMQRASRALEAGNRNLARRELDRLKPADGEVDLRSMDWKFLDKRARFTRSTLPVDGQVNTAFFSADGKTLIVPHYHDKVEVWDVPGEKLLATLKTGEHGISVIALSPDGTKLVTVKESKTGFSTPDVRIWEPRTGRVIADLAGTEVDIAQVTFSPDSRTLATTDYWGGKIRQWDATTGRPVGSSAPLVSGKPDEKLLWHFRNSENSSLLGGPHDRSSLHYTRDGKRLAATSWGRTSLWQVAPLKLLGEVKTDRILAFTPDGKGLFTRKNRADDIVQQWDITKQTAPVLVREWKEAEQVRTSADGGLIAIAYGNWYGVYLADGTQLWKQSREWASHYDMTFSPDGRTLLAGGAYHAGRMALHDARTGKVLDSYAFDGDFVDFSRQADGTVLVVTKPGSREKELGLARVPMAPLAQTQPLGVGRAAFSADGSKLVTAYEVLDLTTGHAKPMGTKGQQFDVWYAGGDAFVVRFSGKVAFADAAGLRKPTEVKLSSSVTFAMAGKCLLRCNDEGLVKIHDGSTGETVGTLPAGDLRFSNVSALVGSAKGRWAAGITESAESILWDLQTRKILKRWGRGDGVGLLMLPPDEKTLLYFDGRGRLTACDLPSLAPRWVSSVRIQGLVIAYAPDGRAVALRDKEGGVQILDLTTGRLKGRYLGAGAGKYGKQPLRYETLAFSPDGKLVAVGGPLGEVCLLDAESAVERVTLPGPGTVAACLSFSPCGRRLFAGYDEECRLWAVPGDTAKLPPLRIPPSHTDRPPLREK